MKLLLIIATILSPLAALAQSTTVTATITDSDGQTWNNGTATATFVPGPTQNYKWTGGTIPSTVTAAMNGSGTFTMSVPDNTLIKPMGSAWRFSICPDASAQCVSTQITVSGASLDLSSQLSSIAKGPRFPATPLAWGYLDVEIYPTPVQGAFYWNVTRQIARQWTGTAWQDWDGGGGVIGGSTTANEGVGAADANDTLAPVPEVNYVTSGGNTTYACQEDHNAGVWDVRCNRDGTNWDTNPSQALANTIHDAMCYYFTNGSPSQIPLVKLPAGSYSIGGNISLPPNIDVEGTGNTLYGNLTQLTTTDPTQPMFTQVNSEVFSCNGTNYTDTGPGATLGNVYLIGHGSTASTDIGVVASSYSSDIHNITFTDFGGPGRTASGATNSHGSFIFASSNLQWYFWSGQYNSSGFTDTTPHGSLELMDLDAKWDHVEEYGWLQDSGYYDRYYLSGIVGVGTQLTDSFIQINPHNIWIPTGSSGSIQIVNNRFDDGWWDSIHITNTDVGIHVLDNWLNGYCTSTTLNPSNFPSNPGGVTTDANCAAIEDFNLGSDIGHNSIGESGGIWPSWPVGDVYHGGNVIGGLPSVIDQHNNSIIGSIGGPSVNPGADVSRSLYNITFPIHTGGGNIPLTNTSVGGRNYAHYSFDDSSAASYTGVTGGFPDTYLTFTLQGSNDTIVANSTIITCTGLSITSGIHEFWYTGAHLYEICPSGFTIGGPLTVSTLPSASSVPAGTPIEVSDGNGTPPTCTGGGTSYQIAISDGTAWSCH